MQAVRIIRNNFHLGMTALLSVALVPLLVALNLPVRFDWSNLLIPYWVGFPVQSVVVASLLYFINFPFSQTAQPLWARYRKEKQRLLILIPLWIFLRWLYDFWTFVLVAVFAVVMFEVVDRAREDQFPLSKAALQVLGPAAYFLLGLILVFSYNDMIVILKPYVAYDEVFNRMDSRILMGHTVTEIAHRAIRLLPLQLLKFLEFLYFGMFDLVGAGMIITSLYFGRKRAIQFVGTILTAYYLTLILFYLWPSQGPYYLCSTHFAEFPHSLLTYSAQKLFLDYARLLWEHRHFSSIGWITSLLFLPCTLCRPLF